MVRIKLVNPHQLPERIAAVAVHRNDDSTILLRDDLTTRQAADWINTLGRRTPGDGEHPRGSTPTPQ